MKIFFEKEIIDFLKIPSIPLKKWDGKSSFKNGVAVLSLIDESEAYAVATFDSEKDNAPRIKKVFSQVPFNSVGDIFIVPSYMDVDNIEDMDLDNESKEAARRLAEEAEELENDGVEEHTEMPDNEWCFDEIHNLDEAIAWVKSYNSRNRIKGRIPKDEETVKLRLLTIWKELNQKK